MKVRQIKKIISLCFFTGIFLSIFSFFSCKAETESPVRVESLSITGTSSLTAGETSLLKVTVKPDNASNKKVTWSTSDSSIAGVNQNGLVTAVKEGSVTITVTSLDSNKKASVTVTVTKKASEENQGSESGGNSESESENGSGSTGGSESGENESGSDSGSSENIPSIDWASLVFAEDGVGGGTYNNKYKFYCATEKVSLVNIQKPGFAEKAGLYITFPAGLSDCSLSDESYVIDGAGIIVYLDAITAKVTGFTVSSAGTPITAYIYYVDGTGSDGSGSGNESGSESGGQTGGESESGSGESGSEGGTESGSGSETPSVPHSPTASPSVTIPSSAYVIHNSEANVSTFGSALNWNAGSTILSDFTYSSNGKKAKKVEFVKNSAYEAFYVATKSLDTTSPSKLYLSVYAGHNFAIKAMTTNREDSYPVDKEGEWKWYDIEYDLGSASEITMIVFVSSIPQTIYVDKVYVTGLKAESGTGGNGGAGGGNTQVTPDENLTAIILSGPDSVNVTSQINLTAAAVPETASLAGISWQSSDTDIAIVTNKGTVTGLKTGSVTITASVGTITAQKTITVKEDLDPESLVTSPSDITPDSKYPTPFGQVTNGAVGNGQFTICFGAPDPMADYWIMFITGGDHTNKKVKLNTCGVTPVKVGKAGNYNLSLYAVYLESGVPHYSSSLNCSVNVTTNAVAQVLPSDADARLANRTLVKKKDTTTLTLQFENNTGKWTDDQIWVTGYGRNAIGEWCYLNKDGTAIPIQAGTTSKDWSFRFSDVDPTWGLQCKDFSSGRVYFTCGNEPVTMNAVIDGNGNIGVAQPNMAIENDENAKKYFDWIEFTAGNVLYVNTTQVDAFTFPIVVADYAEDGMGGYEWKKSVGVTKSRKAVFDAWDKWTNTYTNYKKLVRCNGTRILAPCKVPKTDFDMTYMDSYISDVWNYYKTHDLHYSEAEHGTYTGRVYEIAGRDGKTKNVLIMTRQGDGKKFYVYDTPNMEEAFEGSGKLAMDCSPAQSIEWFGTAEYGNEETSKNVQNRICSAFTRHAFIKQGDDYINVMDNPDRYYEAEPANMYSAFWHKEAGNLDGYAYGFAYDDNHDQSTTTVDGNCRGVIVGIGAWE